MLRILAGFAVVLALAAAGCGGDDEVGGVAGASTALEERGAELADELRQAEEELTAAFERFGEADSGAELESAAQELERELEEAAQRVATAEAPEELDARRDAVVRSLEAAGSEVEATLEAARTGDLGRLVQGFRGRSLEDALQRIAALRARLEG